jgi:hypothetical protein
VSNYHVDGLLRVGQNVTHVTPHTVLYTRVLVGVLSKRQLSHAHTVEYNRTSLTVPRVIWYLGYVVLLDFESNVSLRRLSVN